MTTIRITYDGDTAIMTWDGTQASAPILLDGEATQYQTADAQHRTEQAVRLVAALAWGHVYETRREANASGSDRVCVWDELEYETVEAAP